MKIELYFDVRFLVNEKEHNRAEEKGCYIEGGFTLDHVFRFSRKVSLPCLPQRGQVYHLAFDPICEMSYADDATHYYVQQSGYIEDADHIVPYFIISDDQLFSEWLEGDPARAELSSQEQTKHWIETVCHRLHVLIKVFKEHGWDLEFDQESE